MIICKSIQLPTIGYGTYPQKESLRDVIPLVELCGYTLIDTADNYFNEEFVGEVLQKTTDELRENLIVISKFSQPLKTAEIRKCFEDSKEKLNGKLDIYLLHWPYPFLWKKQWRQMEELYFTGCCKAIGVCNFDEKHLKRLLSFCRVKPFINQIECHPLFQQRQIVDFCNVNKIQVMCYSPVARMHSKLKGSNVLAGLAKKYRKTIGQIILRWDIQNGRIPIPGSSTFEHIKENIDIFSFSLTDEEIKEIDTLEEGKRIRYDPNKRFGLKEKLRFLVYRIQMIGRVLVNCKEERSVR